MSETEGMRSQGSHEHRELRRADLHPDPIGQFLSWFDDAGAAGIALPNAMALATTGADGQPSVRHVLLRDVDQRGLVFYTNHGSRKGRQLEENPRAAIVFLWKELDRHLTDEAAWVPIGNGTNPVFLAKNVGNYGQQMQLLGISKS